LVKPVFAQYETARWYWPLDGNGDYALGGTNLTYEVGTLNWVAGHTGQGLDQQAGLEERICGSLGEWNGSSLDFTICLWEKPDSLLQESASLAGINATHSNSRSIGLDGNQIRSGIYNLSPMYQSSVGGRQGGQWSLICVSYHNNGDGSSDRTYRLRNASNNNKAVTTSTGTLSPVSTSQFCIGDWGALYYLYEYQEQYNGIIDDVAIWQYVISDGEFESVYLGNPQVPSLIQENSFTDLADGEVDFEISGNFLYTGEGYSVRMDLFQQCGEVTGDFELQSHVISTIYWYADDDVTSTIDHGSYVYTGSGYTSTDSSFGTDFISVPYVNEYNCTYPAVIRIFNEQGEVVHSYIEPEITGYELIPTGSTAHIDNTITTPDSDSPFIWLWNKIKELVIDIFDFSSISSGFIQNMTEIKTFALTKVPFAYTNAVFGQDYSAPTETKTDSNISLNLAGNYFLDDYEVTLDSVFDTALSSIRVVVGVLIWLGFIFYLFKLYQRFI